MLSRMAESVQGLAATWKSALPRHLDGVHGQSDRPQRLYLTVELEQCYRISTRNM